MSPDKINALFEFGGAILLWLNVRQLWRDRQVRGVSLYPVVFYSVWGAWNLYYYPALGQMWSAVAGVGVLLANVVWLTGVVLIARRSRG